MRVSPRLVHPFRRPLSQELRKQAFRWRRQREGHRNTMKNGGVLLDVIFIQHFPGLFKTAVLFGPVNGLTSY